MNNYSIGITGNPNCGKTTLFNSLTGSRQRVGNWPGVTVEKKIGHYRNMGVQIKVIDTPGIYSLSATSVDETVARDFILSGEADIIVNIVDASNLERNLYLTSQLIEMQVPVIVALNMIDIARQRGITIDTQTLEKELGCPVVPLTATKNQGTDQLKDVINQALVDLRPSFPKVSYPKEIEKAVTELAPYIQVSAAKKNWNARWMTLKLLENDEQIVGITGSSSLKKAESLQQSLKNNLKEDADILIATAHYEFINKVTAKAVSRKGQATDSMTDKIDRVVLNRMLGIPIFLAAMYLMFIFTINLGGAFIDFFDQFTGTLLVAGSGKLLEAMGTPLWLKTILSDGIGGGIQTMATFIPPIGFMFLFLSFLEDSGYMARGAFVMDRFMRVLGLPGKSFIPMLIGFGCNVPAIMATRTLENERDRTLTIMMNPFMSCGARLPVYALFAAAFFPAGGQNLVFLLYLTGIGFAVITGLFLKHTLLKGEISPFVLELPPYHLPTVKTVLLRTYDRLKTFLFKAGRVLLPVIVVLTFLNSLGTDGTFGNEDTENSVLASIGKTLTPIFHPLGITDENWPATVGVFTGIFAKEAVVGTLNSLYSSIDSRPAGMESEEETGFMEALAASFATVPANLLDLAASLGDPLGISVGNISDPEVAARQQEVNVEVYGSMVSLFGSKAAAFAYLLFILLYFPCSAAIAAVYRETNLDWTLFAGFWTTFMAYFASTIFYQAATLASHPAQSAGWIAADLLALGLAFTIMKKIGTGTQTQRTMVATVNG